MWFGACPLINNSITLYDLYYNELMSCVYYNTAKMAQLSKIFVSTKASKHSNLENKAISNSICNLIIIEWVFICHSHEHYNLREIIIKR